MPKLKNQYPKNCQDKNQSFSWYHGKRIYHGVWGSPEAEKNYKRFIARLLENPVLPLQGGKTGDVIVSELAAGFLNYVEIQQDKTEFQHFKRAIGFLIEFYGELAVNEFLPKKLKVCRNQMVKAGTMCRSQINKQSGRIIRIFAWGVEEELVQPKIVAALREVKNLQPGKQGTFDNPPRLEVSDEVVKRTLPFLSPTVATMVKLQRITGMRPSEIYRMTAGDIDKSKEQVGLWHYILKTHKTEKRVGGVKIVPLGKPEQALITPYLVGKTADESVFSPRRASQERRERQRAERKSKLTPSQAARFFSFRTGTVTQLICVQWGICCSTGNTLLPLRITCSIAFLYECLS